MSQEKNIIREATKGDISYKTLHYEVIKSSALIRIADAAELMAKRSAEQERDIIYHKGRAKYWHEKYERLSRQLQAQKALASRYKNRLDRLEKELEVLQEENNNLR